MIVTKLNPKTIKGVEIKGSYSQGTLWTVDPRDLYLAPEYMPDTRLREIAKRLLPK